MGQGGLRVPCCDAAAAKAARATHEVDAPAPTAYLGGRKPDPILSLISCCEEELPADHTVLLEYQLLSASADGDLALIQMSLDSGVSIEARRPLVFSAAAGKTEPEKEDMEFEEVMVLESQGSVFQSQAHVGYAESASSTVDAAKHRGLTPLMRAAKEGRLQAVSLLLDREASPHAQDEEGRTALHYAAAAGCRSTCSALLKAGANRWALDDDERDAFATVPREFLGSTKERAEWLALLRPDGTY